MSKCGDCKHYQLESDEDGFIDEWCELNIIHSDDCPDFEEW